MTKKVLIIGCKPWDDNVQEVQKHEALKTATFVDFNPMIPQDQWPENFKFLDVRNQNTNGARNFKYFAQRTPNYRSNDKI